MLVLVIRALHTHGLGRLLGRDALVGTIGLLLSVTTYAAATSDSKDKSLEEQLLNSDLSDAEEIERLLTLGLDVNSKVNGLPIIVAAAGIGQLQVVRILVEGGADVNAQGLPQDLSQEEIERFRERGLVGITPMVTATLGGRVETVRYLVEAGADTNPVTVMGPALILASRLGHSDIVEILLAAEADVHVNWKGLPAIFHAVSSGHVDVVKLLIEAGAYEPYKGSLIVGGLTLRAMAAEHPEIAKLLQTETAGQ